MNDSYKNQSSLRSTRKEMPMNEVLHVDISTLSRYRQKLMPMHVCGRGRFSVTFGRRGRSQQETPLKPTLLHPGGLNRVIREVKSIHRRLSSRYWYLCIWNLWKQHEMHEPVWANKPISQSFEGKTWFLFEGCAVITPTIKERPINRRMKAACNLDVGYLKARGR